MLISPERTIEFGDRFIFTFFVYKENSKSKQNSAKIPDITTYADLSKQNFIIQIRKSGIKTWSTDVCGAVVSMLVSHPVVQAGVHWSGVLLNVKMCKRGYNASIVYGTTFNPFPER